MVKDQSTDSQRKWGCKGCFYADEKELLKGNPCCTKNTLRGVDSTTGICNERRNRFITISDNIIIKYFK